MNFKRFLKVLGTCIILLVIVGIVLISLVNTERNKVAILEAILNTTGYELAIAGDISINLSPSFGFTLNDVRLRNPAFNQELASTTSVFLSTDFQSLLHGHFYIRELIAKDFHINVYTDFTGNNIWKIQNSAPLDLNNQIIDSSIESDERLRMLPVSIGAIRITNASVDFQNAQDGLRYNINNLNLNTRGTNFEGQPFETNLNFNFLNNGMSRPVPMNLRTIVSANINSGEIELYDLNFSVTPMLVTGAISINGVTNNLSYQGTLESNDFDVMAFMQTLGYIETPEEFSKDLTSSQDLSYNLNLSGNTTQLTVDEFNATLDNTNIQANGDIRFATDFVPANVRYEVITSSIDFSPFTAAEPKADTEEPSEIEFPSAAPQDNRGNNIELPFKSLQSLNVLGSISIESITVNELLIRDVNLFTNVEDGVLDIELQPTSLYGGTVQGLIRVDSHSNDSTLESQLGLNQLNIAEFAPLISRYNTATGQLNIEASYRATGSTTNELLNSLNGSTTFAITQSSVDIGLIKQVFTAIAALSPSGESIQQWPDLIQFNKLGGYILLEDGITDNQELKLRMDNFDVSGTGGIDLESGSFDYDLQFAILGLPEAQAIPINNIYHDIPWPVTCNARFADEVNQYCRPDFAQVRQIFAQLSSNTLRRQLQEQNTNEVPSDMEETAREILRRILN